MERLPVELCLKILCLLDYHNLATTQRACRKWRALGSDDILWANLFKERWGQDQAMFYAPHHSNSNSKSWKDVYQVQHRCDRVGLGLKIIREGVDYYLIHRGEIQRYLGSRRERKMEEDDNNGNTLSKQGENQQQQQQEGSLEGGGPSYGNGNGNENGNGSGILDQILFFIGDMEVATLNAKRGRVL